MIREGMGIVSAGIYEELALVCCFFLLGVFLAACYDLLRIFRGLIPHGSLWINMEDLIYWIYVAVVIFVMLYEKNDGQMRGFVLGGILVGMAAYAFSFSRICTPKIIHLLQRIERFLLGPFRWLGSKLSVQRQKASAKCRKIWISRKKRLKKLWNTVKICLGKL